MQRATYTNLKLVALKKNNNINKEKCENKRLYAFLVCFALKLLFI